MNDKNYLSEAWLQGGKTIGQLISHLEKRKNKNNKKK